MLFMYGFLVLGGFEMLNALKSIYLFFKEKENRQDRFLVITGHAALSAASTALAIAIKVIFL